MMKKLLCYTVMTFLMLVALTGCANTQQTEIENIKSLTDVVTLFEDNGIRLEPLVDKFL